MTVSSFLAPPARFLSDAKERGSGGGGIDWNLMTRLIQSVVVKARLRDEVRDSFVVGMLRGRLPFAKPLSEQ